MNNRLARAARGARDQAVNATAVVTTTSNATLAISLQRSGNSSNHTFTEEMVVTQLDNEWTNSDPQHTRTSP